MRNTPTISTFSTLNTFAEMTNIPAISVPFPPNITAEDYLKRRKDGSFPSKSMNSFMLYRIAFNKELRARGLCVRQQAISRQISDSWQNEPEHVRQMYRLLAIRAHEELDQIRKCNLGSVPLFTFATDVRICYSDSAQTFNSDHINSNQNNNSPMLHPAEAAPDSIQIASTNSQTQDSSIQDEDIFINYLNDFLPYPELSSDGTFMDLNYLTLSFDSFMADCYKQ
ncbi:8008_t:CDS:1 [Ambispora leptoticha]|uniref:8008_t:CDS:1 n=1 Tax=Ambispora leptoticha TaxID=144679 RepID=A0A9N8ZYS8_9GLOM|nr:8008_t:CDS:1 [Ambispora leptoticha]